jgi:micrococcal nuclease
MATFPPNVRYVELFRALQADAQGAGLGLWGSSLQPLPPVSRPSSLTTGAYDPLGGDKDCSDFKTQAEAQAFFEAAGGPARDPHRLDSDRDGFACETPS